MTLTDRSIVDQIPLSSDYRGQVPTTVARLSRHILTMARSGQLSMPNGQLRDSVTALSETGAVMDRIQ
jgi:hypothetical protein